MVRKITFSMIALLGLLNAGELSVCKSGCDYSSIQEAINNATNGDTITIARGLYQENLSIKKCVSLVGKDGNATIDANSNGRAITIYFNNSQDCTLSLKNLQLTSGNVENGGAVYVRFDSYSRKNLNVNMENLEVVGNSATNWGGGLYIREGGASVNVKVNIKDSLFSGNSATIGGAIASYGGDITISNTTLISNSSTSSGGAIYQDNSESSLIINNSVINKNNANGSGGGISFGGKATINKSWIYNNTASLDGGGIDLHNTTNSVLTLISSIIALNDAGEKGGAICIGKTAGGYFPGSHKVLIKSSTIATNSAKTGNNIYIANGHDYTVSTQILNSAVDSLSFAQDNDGKVYGTYIVKNSFMKKEISVPANTNLTKENIKIVDDYGYKDSRNEDWSLKPDAVVINKADLASSDLQDITNQSRDNKPDVGACEYPHECKPKVFIPLKNITCPSDVNDTNNSTPQIEVEEVNATLNIAEGWNLVSIPGYKSKSLNELFGDDLKNVEFLWLWQNGWYFYTSDEELKKVAKEHINIRKIIDENFKLEPNKGFWIRSSAPMSKGFSIKSVKK